MLRTTQVKNISESQKISETITLKGNQLETAWFDAYKLDINCKLTT